MSLLLIEENAESFFPLTLTCATFELRFGAMSALERARQIGDDIVLRCRPHLAAYLRLKTGLRVNEDFEGEGELFPVLPEDAPWKILALSADLIASDFENWAARRANFRDIALMNGAHVVGSPNEIHIGARSVVQPGCVLDCTHGPIMLGEDVSVKWSQIKGPVFVGDGCVLDGARVRQGTSIGAHCKIGGEVSASIFQGRTNKAHEGFVGHSWIGRWANLGALATTSNLKNTLGNIRFQRDSSTRFDTQMQFLGSLIGDYSKIGVGQMLTTGSNIGVGCNIFGGRVAPSYVPSFCWGGADGWQEYRFDKFLETARATMARHDIEVRSEIEAILREIFMQTQSERRAVFGL